MSDAHPFLRKFNVLFYSFFLKLIPCIILTLVTALLVKAMVQVLDTKSFLLINKSPTTPMIEGNEKSSKVKRYEPPSREKSFS